LVYWRRRIAASKRPDRVCDAVAAVIAETGMLRGRRKRCVDSTVFDDAVATQDTVTQLVAAIRKVARVVPGAAEVIDRVCRLDYSQPGKPAIDWDDPQAKQTLISDLVNDALAVLAELAGENAPQREGKAADALGLLALVAGQDVEPGEGSDGTDGRWRIARKVAGDRVISTVDPQARHTRKSKSVRRDGYRGHVAAEPETGLITDCQLTKAAGEDGSDPVVGEQMISRDRYHQNPTEAAAHPQPADDEPAGPAHAGPQAADQANTATAPVADSRCAVTDQDGVTTAANTDPAGNQRCDTCDHEQDQGREVYGDSAYGTGAARAAYRAGGHDTVIKPKPLRPVVEGGYTLDDFTIDEQTGTVTCPAGHTRPMSATRTASFGKLCAGCPLHHRRQWPVDDHPPARGPATRRPRPGPHPTVQTGLPHPLNHRADHRLDRHPERAAHQTALPRHHQKPRLATHPRRRHQPTHPHQPRPHPPQRHLDPGLTDQGAPPPLPAPNHRPAGIDGTREQPSPRRTPRPDLLPHRRRALPTFFPPQPSPCSAAS
jgi:hypothetical protein